MKNKIICTLGPSSFKTRILSSFKKLGVHIYRINMSHTSLNQLEKKIKYLKKNKIKNICIDTEGAQLRTTKVKKKIYLRRNKKIFISNKDKFSNNKIINFYPIINLKKINKGSHIHIGFDNLVLKAIKVLREDLIISKVITEGYLESNKGVHVSNSLSLDALTKKDIEAIKIACRHNLKYFAMSFVNQGKDVDLLKKK